MFLRFAHLISLLGFIALIPMAWSSDAHNREKEHQSKKTLGDIEPILRDMKNGQRTGDTSKVGAALVRYRGIKNKGERFNDPTYSECYIWLRKQDVPHREKFFGLLDHFTTYGTDGKIQSPHLQNEAKLPLISSFTASVKLLLLAAIDIPSEVPEGVIEGLHQLGEFLPPSKIIEAVERTDSFYVWKEAATLFSQNPREYGPTDSEKLVDIALSRAHINDFPPMNYFFSLGILGSAAIKAQPHLIQELKKLMEEDKLPRAQRGRGILQSFEAMASLIESISRIGPVEDSLVEEIFAHYYERLDRNSNAEEVSNEQQMRRALFLFTALSKLGKDPEEKISKAMLPFLRTQVVGGFEIDILEVEDAILIVAFLRLHHLAHPQMSLDEILIEKLGDTRSVEDTLAAEIVDQINSAARNHPDVHKSTLRDLDELLLSFDDPRALSAATRIQYHP